MSASSETCRVQYIGIIKLIKSCMKKIFWPIIALLSITFSTYAFILGSKIIEKTQTATPIYITYPEGYRELPELPKPAAKKVKGRK